MSKPSSNTVRMIDLGNITIDHGIQSRVRIDMEAMHEFSEAIARGDVFPPADVFFDGRKYWLADGFHRHGAHQRAGENSMRCVVHQGSRRDAIIFSAGSNKQFSVKRTVADIHKAICMLLEDKEWFPLSNAQLADHVGCAGQTVARVREEFCREQNREMPDRFVSATGAEIPTHREFGVKSRRPYLKAHDDEDKLPARYSLEYGYIRDLFSRRFGFQSVVGQGAGYPGLKALFRKGEPSILMTPCDFILNDSLPLAVGRLVLAREMCEGTPGRCIILCYAENGPKLVMEIAERLGVDFVAPEFLIAALKEGQRTLMEATA
jgi:hypothetical protein